MPADLCVGRRPVPAERIRESRPLPARRRDPYRPRPGRARSGRRAQFHVEANAPEEDSRDRDDRLGPHARGFTDSSTKSRDLRENASAEPRIGRLYAQDPCDCRPPSLGIRTPFRWMADPESRQGSRIREPRNIPGGSWGGRSAWTFDRFERLRAIPPSRGEVARRSDLSSSMPKDTNEERRLMSKTVTGRNGMVLVGPT